jgi:hypothetical protein
MANSPDYFDFIEAGWKDTVSIDLMAKVSKGRDHALGIITTTWDGWDKNADGIRHTAEAAW